MAENPNEVTPDNSVLVFIDHQPWVAFPVNSIEAGLLTNNLKGLASCAKALDIPVVLTTVGAEGALKDPIMSHIGEIFPDIEPIDRVSTNAWADIREAVAATGRKTLVLCGLWTEVCLAQTGISALKEGYRVFFVSDCSGGVSVEAHEDAKTRLVAAGATPLNWVAVACEWTPDYTSKERQATLEPFLKYGAMPGIALEYVVTNTASGNGAASDAVASMSSA
jgi:nicotinamidase-related amidase